MANAFHQLADVNNVDHASFILHFGSIYEHSAWVAQGAWGHRPFESVDALHAAMDSVMFVAPTAKQIEFGFPFIICARLNGADSIVSAMRARLDNNPEAEFQTALAEISKIARLRLGDLVL
jgi:2-oxo-4-hydroxy-4-carboxy--5-ureidoimidazoline (OHCU) decarboxylase